jgi:POT family proton-dependent oligopeptide transporter
LSAPSIPEKFAQSAARHGYATAPVKTPRLPPGIPYIVVSEAAERFSFYGMNAILTAFMAGQVFDDQNRPLPHFGLLDSHGSPAPMSDSHATAAYHLFVFGAYFMSFLGAIVSDSFFGKFRTVMVLSIVYCFGHLALALDSTRLGLFIGLALIALGAGGIKPCVSSNVGDQFGESNQHLMSRVFGWFYFAINFGAVFSQYWIPDLLVNYGPHLAFAVPGILMLIATVIFWSGRRKFVHLPPSGQSVLTGAFSPTGRSVVGRLAGIYVFFIIYWALYYQSSSTWVLQAGRMNLRWLGHDWIPSQVQCVNSVLILVFIPLFTYAIYPAISRFFKLTPLRKISIGFFLMVAAFLIAAWVEQQLEDRSRPNILWQFVAYVFLTASEIMVSITGLEFSYAQAPRKMKSFVMALFFCSVALGNLLDSAVNELNEQDGRLVFSYFNYYLFFTALMLGASVLFIFVARNFKSQPVPQEDSSTSPARGYPDPSSS